jgi:dienelactone hydrolase
MFFTTVRTVYCRVSEALMSDQRFDYSAASSLDVRVIGSRRIDAGTLTDLRFDTSLGWPRTAYLVRPDADGPLPVVLYVHWYEPKACDSNRTQFLEEAERMAGSGAMSLLIETMWSDREWFVKRTQADDVDALVRQTIELRRAMDLLLAQPDADPARFAYVGHDFGAMVGVLAGSVDPRPSCYVLMAGTPRFSDWFLYYPQLDGEARSAFIRQISPLDPIERIAALAPAPLLFQFGNADPHVPADRGEAFFRAAREPKDAIWYDAGHALNEDAARDREAWLLRGLQA